MLKSVLKKMLPEESAPRRALVFVFRRLPYVMSSKFNAPRAKQILHNFAQDRRDAYFVQIGANDGSNDPIAEYIKSSNWRGILVEPLPPTFERLKRRYEDRQNLIFENVAISDQSGTFSFYYLEGSGHDRKASLLRDQVVSYCRDIGADPANISRADIRCLTVADLLEKHSVRKLDLLVIDTEGLDAQILKQIDFNALAPDVILYEDMGLKEVEKAAAKSLLKRNGYRTISFWGDVLAVRKG